jgi:hypothetical protein
MAFPIPVDARAVHSFEPVMGQDDILRQSLALADLTKSVLVGEWMKVTVASGVPQAAKLAVGVDVLATPAPMAAVSWTQFFPGDTWNGQSDAVATGQVDLLRGKYQAKTKLYNTGGTFNPGDILLAVYTADRGDGVAGGWLDAVAQSGATARQLANAVGKVVALNAGVLWYESL